MFRRLLGKETPEEKSARESAAAEKALRERQAAAEKAWAKDAADFAKKYPGVPFPVPSPTAALTAPTPHAQPSNLGAMNPVDPNAGAAATTPAAAAAPGAAAQQQQPPQQQQLSHEQQLKQQALQAQQAQMLAQNSNVVSSLAPSSSAASAASPASSSGVGHPAACQDCGQHLSSVLCDDCASSGAASLFCAECDTAFHRPNTKRGTHSRRPAPIIPPIVPSEPLPSGVVGTFVPLGMDPNNPSHVSNLHDSSPSPPAAPAVEAQQQQQQSQPSNAVAAGPEAQQQQPQPPPPQQQPQQPDHQQMLDQQQQQQQADSVQSFQPQQQQQSYPDQSQQLQQQQPQQQQMQPQPFMPSDHPDDAQSPQQQQLQQPSQQQPQQQQWDSQQQPREYASDVQDALSPMRQQQGDQPQQQQQQQQQQQRPVIPAMPLGLAQDLNQQQMLTPRTAAAGGRHTPRNADGSINFDASHRHTPRSEAERAASLQQLQQAQQAQASGQPPQHQSHHMHHPSLMTSSQNDTVKDLAPEEVEELREMFLRYDRNGDSYLALDEIGAFLHELEFTYSESFIQFLVDHVFGLHIHERVVAGSGSGSGGSGAQAQKSIKGQLTFSEFLEFMRVFYWLHDAVYAEIDRQFTLAFGREIDDEIVAVLCRFVEFNEHTELDFNEMNRRLVEAVNEEAARAQAEKEEAAAIARGEAPSNSARAREQQREILSSPLHQQHLAQARREADMAAGEDARTAEMRRQEQEEWARRQALEDQQKAALAAQKDQYRQEAFQMQAARRAAQGAAAAGDQTNLSPVNEYPDASEDLQSRQRSESGSEQDDPFAAHGGSGPSASTTIPLRQGPASLLAHSLDASDEAYLQRSWSLLLKHFDRSRSGGINAKDIGQAFRAMGLDPSSAQLNDFFLRADLDGSGSINYPEFKSYYSALFQSYLRRGLDLGQLKKIFSAFDEDGDRRVTTAEFRHVVKQICPSDTELSQQDVERLTKLADRNNDGIVDFAEFLELIRISTGEQPPSAAVAGMGMAGGADDERARHELLMSYHAARALTRKIIRAYMPSPMEHLFAYAHMPSTFRPSMLARYQTREEFFPSSILNPVLHCSGLYYEQLQMDPRTTMLRPQPLHASTGTPSVHYLSYHIELEHASGIPLPDVAHRSDIVARRVRVCVLEGGPNSATPLSNLYMCKAEWSAAEEDRWNFQLRFKENDANSFAFKTTAREATVLFELTCLVKKQTGNPGQQIEKNVHPSESSFVEMSCGFATLELDLSTPLQKETRLVLGILGGNLSQALAIKDSEILARRSGFKAFTQLFSGPVKSALSLKLSPASCSLRSEDRFVSYFRFLPCDLIVSWSSVEVVKLFLELLAGLVLLPQNQPLQMGKSSQLAIQLFLKGVVDVADMLQVLAELWSETRKGLKKSALREHDQGAIVHGASSTHGGSGSGGGGGGGSGSAANDPSNDTSSAHLLSRFRRTILKLYPAMSMAPGALPPLIIGISDLRRLSLLRALVHVADPLAVLTADGMLRSVATGAAGAPTGVTRAPMSLARAASVQNVRADVAAATNAAAQAAFQSSGGGTGGIGGRRSSGGALTAITIGTAGSEDAMATLDPYAGSVEFRHVYAPFHTNEIAYDPNAHSEDHHLERRSQIAFQLASGGQGQME